jgi:hypothetical protein
MDWRSMTETEPMLGSLAAGITSGEQMLGMIVLDMGLLPVP